MHYEIVELKEAKIAGLAARTNNSSPDMENVISGLWQRFFAEGGYSAIPDKISGSALGIYTDYESDERGDYTFMTGCAVTGDAPEGFEVRTLPAGKYARFTVVGDMVTAVKGFWQQLWEMPLDRTYVFDFEEYRNADPENCEIHIYIGIR